MSKYIVMTFATTPQLKAWLESQAQADERSVSYILRKILEEQRRRQQAQQTQKQPKK